MRKLHPIDDKKTSSSLCIEHIFVFLAEFLEYKVDEFLEYKVDDFCDQIPRKNYQEFPGWQHGMLGHLHPANQV